MHKGPGRVWRLLDTGVRTAAENMALDEVLLTVRSQGLAPNTLRFLQFAPNAVLVGFHQAVEQEVREAYCRQRGIDINRRITGGGAIYFDRTQLGWELILDPATADLPARPDELSARLAAGAVEGLRRLGLEAAYRPRNDIEVRGRKISGTGGTRMDGAWLFQGTLLVDFDVDTMLRALRLPTEKLKDKEIVSFRQRVTSLREELGRVPDLAEIQSALASGLAGVLDIELEPAGLLPPEKDLLAERLPYFHSEEWIYGVRRSPRARQVLTAAYRAPGGLVRMVVDADAESGRIRSAFITGDFFAFPQRFILDLEASLKDAPLDAGALRRHVDAFFAANAPIVPGVTADDFYQCLLQAIRKLDLPAAGIPAENVNHVYTVGAAYPEVPAAGALLLPYCAKPVWCPYRYEDGCGECGMCTVGEAYRMARERGLRPISICNYEHLESTLEGLKAEGHTAFVGSCCHAFYAKHQGDFERIGLPGVLVDIDDVTCYDLGEELEAHQGVFDKETRLKLDLLEKVLDHAVRRRNGEP